MGRVAAALATWLALGSPAWAQDAPRPAPPPSDQLLAPGRAGWVVDPANGCWVWISGAPSGTARWSGACPGGPATGIGAGEFRSWEAGRKAIMSWVGSLRDGRLNGYATVTWPEGHRYAGTWLDDRQHGYGSMSFANGNRYEGEWRNGDPDGRGAFTWPDGDRYEGGWRAGRSHGSGTLTVADGSLYKGEWRDDRPNGHGAFYIAAQDRWILGRWRNGCFNDGVFVAYIRRTLAECRQLIIPTRHHATDPAAPAFDRREPRDEDASPAAAPPALRR
jgi:hypothetical protein